MESMKLQADDRSMCWAERDVSLLVHCGSLPDPKAVPHGTMVVVEVEDYLDGCGWSTWSVLVNCGGWKEVGNHRMFNPNGGIIVSRYMILPPYRGEL